MRMTVLGCSGSVAGPDSPASGYLLTADDELPLVLDLGYGTLGALQRYLDPAEATYLLSHLHPDHCADMAALLVWRRYHPQRRPGRNVVHGPGGTAARLGALAEAQPGTVDDVSDVLDVREWAGPFELDGWSIRPDRVVHSAEAYAMRITHDGRSLVYTGDTAACDELRRLTAGVDVLLAEASWTHTPERPVGIHLSGREAGELARDARVGRLLLTHIPPWTVRSDVLAEARAVFDGPVHAVSADEVIDL